MRVCVCVCVCVCMCVCGTSRIAVFPYVSNVRTGIPSNGKHGYARGIRCDSVFLICGLYVIDVQFMYPGCMVARSGRRSVPFRLASLGSSLVPN